MLTLYSAIRLYAAEHMKKLLRNTDGQTMVEYALLIVLVALAVFVMTPSVTSGISMVFSESSSALGKTWSGS